MVHASTSCSIATPHATATEVAAEVARSGGNAVDAAIAAALVLSVVYPHNTTIGGDLVALVRSPDGRVRCINASGPAARHTDLRAMVERYGGTMPSTGVDTVTVPGAVPGLGVLHELAGATVWNELVAPAAELAKRGVAVAPSLGRALHTHATDMAADGGMAGVFAPSGELLSTGQTMVQPALARSLDTLARDGAASFLTGGVGSSLLAGLRRLGSDLDADDFSTFTPEVVKPLHRDHRGHRVWTSPLNTQGYQLLQVLGAAELLPPDLDLHCADANVLAALWAQANTQRRGLLADPRQAPVDVEEVLDPRRLAEAAEAARTRQVSGAPTELPQPRGDTVAVVAADSDGYAISLIQSVFHSFGALVLEPTTGILLHNRGACFDLVRTSPNCLAGGKRPGHTLMPVMVTRDERLQWVLGTMGGRAQPQIHHQVLTRLLDGRHPVEAVSAPRWVVGGLGAHSPEEQILIETDVPARTTASLRKAGFPLQQRPSLSETLGHAQVVASTPHGFECASDPRSDGRAVVVHRG